MSVTVRLFSDRELEKIKSGEDKLLATIFMNKSTFSEQEIKAYPYGLRHTYICEWLSNGIDGNDSVEVYATDIPHLVKFLKMEYTRLPDFTSEKITHYRDITIK